MEIEQLTAKVDGIDLGRRWFKWLDHFRQKIDSFKNFTPEQCKELLAGILTLVNVFVVDSYTHWLKIQFTINLVGDELVNRDPSNKKPGYANKHGMATFNLEVSKSHTAKKLIEPMA